MPTRKKPAMKKYLVTLPEDQVDTLDTLSLVLGTDRSDLISILAGKALHDERIMNEVIPKNRLLDLVGELYASLSKEDKKKFETYREDVIREATKILDDVKGRSS